MKIVEKTKLMSKISDELKKEGETIAFVPTMGYLHDGHLSLLKKARELADISVVSIFVNPTQFAPNEDFSKYPRDAERDRELLEKEKCDFLFYPSVSEMYPEGFDAVVRVGGITKKFEGEKRPSHFDGVATVVAKLFNIVKPNVAIFGQKDYQQALLIKKLVRDLNFDVQIYVAPIVREKDGLAMSSRNAYLSPELRKQSPALFKALNKAAEAVESGERKRKIINAIMIKELRKYKDVRIDYASAALADDLSEPEEFEPGDKLVLLLACYLGTTRLIDNLVITIPREDEKKFNKSYVENLPRL